MQAFGNFIVLGLHYPGFGLIFLGLLYISC